MVSEFQEFLIRLTDAHLNNREAMSEKLKISIGAHSEGFNVNFSCLIDGYFLIKVYPNIPHPNDIGTDGDPIAVISLNTNESVSITGYNDCWAELVDINEAQYETYLLFNSLPELKERLEHNINRDNRLKATKFKR